MSYYPPTPPPPLPPHLRVKRTEGLAIAVVVLTLLTMLFAIAEGIMAPFVADGLLTIRRGGTGPDFVLFDAFDLVSGIGALMFLTTAILVMIWLSTARSNAVAVSPEARHTRSAAWAVLGWIIPFVAFWFPLQVVRDVRHAFHPDLNARRLPAIVEGRVGWWWTFFLAMILTSNLAGLVMAGESPGEDALAAYGPVELIWALFTVVAGLLWIWVVRSTEAKQKVRVAQATSAAGSLPPVMAYPPQPGYGYPPQPGYGYPPQPGYGYPPQQYPPAATPPAGPATPPEGPTAPPPAQP